MRDAALNETAWASTTTARTLTTRPGGLIMDFVGSASVQVTWGAGINGANTQYSAQVATNTTFTGSSTAVSLLTALSTVSVSLSPNALYYFRVANAAWTGYTSEFSSSPFVTLPATAAPQACTNVTENSITLNWDGGGNPAGTQYRVDVSSTGGIIAQSPWQSALSYDFTGLSPNVTYYFNAKARNSAFSEGGFVSLGSTVTLAASPPAPAVVGGFDSTLLDYLRVTPSFGANPPLTELAIQNTNGQYLQGDGSTATGEVWKTKAEWDSGFTNIEKVLPNISPQSYKVYARNFRGVKNTLPSNLTTGSPIAIKTRELADTNSDGAGDSLKLTFSQNVQDSSVVPGHFSILRTGETAPRQAVKLLSGILGDAANDDVLHLDIGNFYGADEQPFVQHTGVDGLKASNGGALGQESAGIIAADKIAPVLSRVQVVSRGGQAQVLATFSEALNAIPSGWDVESPVGTPVSMAGAGLALQSGNKAVILTFPFELANSFQVNVKAKIFSDARGNSRAESSKTGSILTSAQNFMVAKDSKGRRAKGSSVDAAAQVILFFDREMDMTSVQSGVSLRLIGDKLGNAVDTAWTLNTETPMTGNQMFKFTPASPLPKGSKFRVVMAASIKDAFGFSSGAETSWEFSTAADYTERTVASPAPGFKFVIPPGTFSQDAGLTVVTDPAANAAHTDKAVIARALALELRKAERAGSSTHSPIPSLTFEIVGETPQGGVIQGALGNPVTLTLSYPDADGDGLVDGTSPGVPAKDLALFYLDETLGEFRKIPSQVDTGAKTLTASLSHFSIYAVMGALATTVDSFLIRPNPWEPSKDSLPIILDNLPDPAVITIYSATGQKLATLQGNGASAIDWSGTNDAGEPLASGVYIAVLKSGSGAKSKKLTIIR